MRKAIAVGFLLFTFAALSQAQSALAPYVVPPPNLTYWQQWAAMNAAQGNQSPYVVPPQNYNYNYLLQQYYSPQNQLWQQMQEQNTFQQQYQWQQPTWNYNWGYNNGYEPELNYPSTLYPTFDDSEY